MPVVIQLRIDITRHKKVPKVMNSANSRASHSRKPAWRNDWTDSCEHTDTPWFNALYLRCLLSSVIVLGLPGSSLSSMSASGGYDKSVKGGTKSKLAAPKSKYVQHLLEVRYICCSVTRGADRFLRLLGAENQRSARSSGPCNIAWRTLHGRCVWQPRSVHYWPSDCLQITHSHAYAHTRWIQGLR